MNDWSRSMTNNQDPWLPMGDDIAKRNVEAHDKVGTRGRATTLEDAATEGERNA
jgi:hypothetical protein